MMGAGKARFGGLFPILSTIQAPSVAGIGGQAATGETELRSLWPLGIPGPQSLVARTDLWPHIRDTGHTAVFTGPESKSMFHQNSRYSVSLRDQESPRVE